MMSYAVISGWAPMTSRVSTSTFPGATANWPVAEAIPWCVSCIRSHWKALVSYICSVRASVASITKNVEALAEEYGNLAELVAETRRTFPEPALLAQI